MKVYNQSWTNPTTKTSQEGQNEIKSIRRAARHKPVNEQTDHLMHPRLFLATKITPVLYSIKT
uniref:SFRICE_031296 n=1 Tax=Spodoptera frugiperda TaxID=7108 RepID=A0A2H1VNS7_SPOFR